MRITGFIQQAMSVQCTVNFCIWRWIWIVEIHPSQSTLKTSKSLRVTHSWWFHMMTTKSIKSVRTPNVRGSDAVLWKELGFHRNSSCVCFRCVGSVIILFAETSLLNSLKGNILPHLKSTTSFLNYSSFLYTHTDLMHIKTLNPPTPQKSLPLKPLTSDTSY